MQKERVTEIDLLRFCAALSVVFFHYAFRGYAADDLSAMPYPWLSPVAKYGYLGVDLFFLISGFVILMTAASGSLKKFIASRIARLYPAFWACCTLSFLGLLAFDQKHQVTISQYVVNLTMLSGFVGVPSVDQVYWSLFVEMKFYALVAAMLSVGKIDKAQFFLLAWLVVTLVSDSASYVGPWFDGSWQLVWRVLGSYTFRSWFILDYSPYFIAGAILYLVRIQGLSLIRAGALIISLMAALIHANDKVIALINHYHVVFDVRVVAGIIISIFFIMYMVAAKHTNGFGGKGWVRVGMLTYPLYLLHQNLGFMVFNHFYPSVGQHVLMFGTVLVMLVLAGLVNWYIERIFSAPLKRGVEQMLEARWFRTTRLDHSDEY